MNKTYKITLKDLIYTFLITAVTIICACGVSPVPHALRAPLIIVSAIITTAFIVFKQQSVCLTLPVSLMLISVLYIGISIFYSIKQDQTTEFAIIYIASAVFLLADYNLDFYKKTITAMMVVCLIIAISIVMSVFIDDLMLKYFSFIVNPVKSPEINELIYNEIHYAKSYSGFAREKSEAAFVMNIGVSIYFAKYFSQKKFKFTDVIGALIMCTALILTGKRMLFLCPIAVGVMLMIVSNKKGKLVKIIPGLFFSIVGFIIAAAFIPQLSNLFQRFSEDSMGDLTGRLDLWPYCFEMFAKNPLFGLGIGTYNYYLSLNNVTVYGGDWKYYAHNIYYEFLGELGIVGCVLLFGGLFIFFAQTIALLRKKDITNTERFVLTFSFAIQLTCFIYGLSGNVLLYKQQIFIWFFANAMVANIARKYRKLKKDEITNV